MQSLTFQKDADIFELIKNHTDHSIQKILIEETLSTIQNLKSLLNIGQTFVFHCI